MFLSIITATYNRAYCLPNIYTSLLTNNKDDFEWILVDDGSIDGTESIAKVWMNENKINFRYIKKENEGKTSSIIRGFDLFPKGEFSLVLDSDDYLYEGIIDVLKKECTTLSEDQIGIVGLKSDLRGNLIGSKFSVEFSTYIDMYFGKQKVQGDKLFLIRTYLYKKSMVKPFPNEKFIPDNIPYINVNKYGNFKCMNIFFYKGDYMQDGMTNNVLKMAANNINGYIFEKEELQKQPLSLKEKLTNEIKYISYSFAGFRSPSKILRMSNNKLLTSFLLFPVYIVTYSRIRKIQKIILSNAPHVQDRKR